MITYCSRFFNEMKKLTGVLISCFYSCEEVTQRLQNSSALLDKNLSEIEWYVCIQENKIHYRTDSVDLLVYVMQIFLEATEKRITLNMHVPSV